MDGPTYRHDLPTRLPAAPARALVDELCHRGEPLRALSRRLGVDRRVLQRLATRAWVSVELADRLAVAAGRHPCELWPEWFGQ